MIRFFKTIQPAALFTVPAVVLLFWLPGFFSMGRTPVPFDSLLLNWMLDLNEVVRLVISIVLVSTGAIYLNQVANRHEIIYRHSFLPALFYALLMSFHRDVIQFHPLLVSNLVLIMALDKTLSLFKNDSPVSPIFDSSFLLSVATLIYFPAFLFFFVFLYAMYNLRSFSFREFMIAWMGFALPFFFLAVYGFWTDSLAASLHNFIARFSIHRIQNQVLLKPSLIAFAGYFTLLILLAVVRLRTNFYRNAIKTRSAQEILVLFSLMSAGGLFFLPELALYHLTQLAIPFSIFIAYYFISAKKRFWAYEAALWIIIGFIGASYF